jgi:4-hydroxythreonine-4-phosphate dehydrogenase
MSKAAQIVMIADDLSGAADCAVSCAVRGLHTVVQLSETQSPESQHGGDAAQVLAIDAATRSMPADRAAATIARIVANYEHAPGRVLFKKLDSLLRGHIGPELAAMRSIRTPAVIVMAPALPAQGRTTIDGCQWLNGQRLANADAPRLLESVGLTSAGIELALVRSGSWELAAKLAELAGQHSALVCDAETEGDLRAIAAAIAALPRAGWNHSIIWAGSSGLARHIPEAMGIAGAFRPIEEAHFRGPILLVVGTRSPLAHEQASQAGQCAGMTTVFLTPDTLREGCGSAQSIGQSSALDKALASGNDLMVMIDSSGETMDRETAEDPRLCAALASLLLPHMNRVAALIATGGETARAVLTASDITGLRLSRELEPGVPLAVSAGARQIPVITKSGSFGNRATLANCVRVLRALKLE